MRVFMSTAWEGRRTGGEDRRMRVALERVAVVGKRGGGGEGSEEGGLGVLGP